MNILGIIFALAAGVFFGIIGPVTKTAYNLGVGRGVSVLEVIDLFEKVNELKIPHEIGPRRSGDIEQIYSDNNKINNELGWIPVMTFESALESAWNWEKLKNL